MNDDCVNEWTWKNIQQQKRCAALWREMYTLC